MAAFMKLRATRLDHLKVNGPNVWVDGKRISISLMCYGTAHYIPFGCGARFSIKRTNSEAERKRLMLNYPHYPPADDGYVYYISHIYRPYENNITYVTKGDAAILAEKFKALPAWAIDAAVQ